MQNKKLGCISGSAIIATFITLAVIVGFTLLRGGVLFNPGELNAVQGEMLGGVKSHAEIGDACGRCHAPILGSIRMGDLCADCHTTLAQELSSASGLHGTMLQKNPSLKCRDCHPEHRGTDAALTVMIAADFPHEMLGYSLQGHVRRSDGQDFTCTDCHGNDISAFDLANCETCHRQVDQVYTQAHMLWVGNDCLSCHDGVDTYGSNFDHSQTDYALVGSHAEVLCSTCHKDPRSLADFKNTSQDCAICHAKDDAHQGRFGQNCGMCHESNAWKPAKFDHNLSNFKLEGGHSVAECEECHINNVYAGTPRDCYSCHKDQDEHDGQFGTDCGACHTPSDWGDATFDHNLSNFPLTGAHVNVRCEECHVNAVFKGLASVCVACHEDPVYHAGVFGTDCAACHSTTAWVPARYNDPHTFPINHEGANTCRDCHPSALSNWTCYTCHNQAEMIRKHREENVGNIDDCLRCHPTGREGDGGGD